MYPENASEPPQPSVSVCRLPDGSTGVSLLVPLGELSTALILDGGRVVAQFGVPIQEAAGPLQVPLTPTKARELASALIYQAQQIEGSV